MAFGNDGLLLMGHTDFARTWIQHTGKLEEANNLESIYV